MKYFAWAILFMLITTRLFAQTGKIFGRVLDAKTLQPLPYTNIFINNTTLGVTANNNGEFILPVLPVGPTQIVFSFLGYASQQLNITVKETSNSPLTISLIPDAQQVSEVQVKASRDKSWEKQLKRFEKVFLGNTANCRILNAWAIDFSEEQGLITAKAPVPLEIENRQLGYKLYFQLKKFGYSSTDFFIVGDSRFTELETPDASVALTWMKNREQAYRGSLKHLMKSILDRQINQQGFLLYRDKVNGKLHSTSYSVDLQQNIVPYDTTTFWGTATSEPINRIALREKMEVIYTNDFSPVNYYSDLSNPVSWLSAKNGYVLVNKEGTIVNPADIILSGSMAEGRVSGMLPLDYKPGSLIVPQSAASLLAKRLQESVYLHTDRPYYYPGETLWFSAYMNYRTPSLRDSLSKVLYLDLINIGKKTSQHLTLPIDSGKAAGSFRLPTTGEPGQYVLRAYTQWMRNYGPDLFFYKPITLLDLNHRVDSRTYSPVVDNTIRVSLDQSSYSKRSLVKMTISLDTTGSDEVVQGNFSVAVVDESFMLSPAETRSIKTDFAMVDPPKSGMNSFTYPLERGISLEGVYRDKKGKAKKTRLTLIPETLGGIYPVSTGSMGQFSLSGLAFYDSTQFVIQPAEGSVVLLPKSPPDLPENLPTNNVRLIPLKTSRIVVSDDTLLARMLSTVNVKAKKVLPHDNGYAKPDAYLTTESIGTYASVAEAIAARLPAFKLVYEQTNWYLIWARASVPNSADIRAGVALASHEPNLYINNVLVVGETAGDRLMQLNPRLIDHIEVNGMITANQGANGSGGLINVFMKRATEASSKPLLTLKARGFDKEARFMPVIYGQPAGKMESPDFRPTLYWNPRVTLISGQAPVNLSFFTSDQAGTYRLIIEGVTKKGNPIRSEAVFTVIE